MKIFLTGGGSGGHFYPLIAVAKELVKVLREKHFLDPDIAFVSDSPYNKQILIEENIRFIRLPAGKARRYFSLLNVLDFFKTFLGLIYAVIKIYFEMPDAIFSKGGYAAFPVVFAARILRIPLIIHESDAVPGKVNVYSKKFARRIAISFQGAAKYFPEDKLALTGLPLRKEIMGGTFKEAEDIFHLESERGKFFPPVILIIGGSLGSQTINNVILEILPELVIKYQIIHQCGNNNFKESIGVGKLVLKDSKFKSRYHLFGSLDEAMLRSGSYAADLVISRAGGSAIFEIAAWGKPSILIPLKGAAQDHQRENAWEYAERGAAEVIEETNFSPHILLSEIDNILKSPEKMEKMKKAALHFSKLDATSKIAEEIINLAMEHAD